MPTYQTPTAIDLAIDLKVGRVEVIASERDDTVVTLSTTGAGGRRAADDTRIDFDGRRLAVIGPRPRFSWIGPGQGDAVDITVELPNDSRVTAEVALGDVRTHGRLGAARVKSALGDVELDATGDLWVRASHGSVAVDTAAGSVDITVELGQIRLGTTGGQAILTASHGNIQLTRAGDDVEAKLSYGDLEIATALASVSARTAYGSIRLHEVSGGSIDVSSGYGRVSVGLRNGVSAWLDLSSKEGRVHNELTGESAPEPSEQTVAIRARTRYGDIDVRHAR